MKQSTEVKYLLLAVNKYGKFCLHTFWGLSWAIWNYFSFFTNFRISVIVVASVKENFLVCYCFLKVWLFTQHL